MCDKLLIHTRKLDFTLPEEVFQLIWKELDSKFGSTQYARVILPLSALLEGDVFNKYIKSGTFRHIYLPYISSISF